MNMKALPIILVAVTLLTVISISGCTQSTGGIQVNTQTGANSVEIKNFAFSNSVSVVIGLYLTSFSSIMGMFSGNSATVRVSKQKFMKLAD